MTCSRRGQCFAALAKREKLERWHRPATLPGFGPDWVPSAPELREISNWPCLVITLAAV